MRAKLFACLAIVSTWSSAALGQVDEDELGAWYTYAWSTSPNERGRAFQGDIQYRNWDRLGDLEQLLLRGGVMFVPSRGRARYTVGAAYIGTGAYGPSSATTSERRLYQEALVPGRVGRKVFLTHRVRLEQRWVDGQDFRNRLRYFFGLNYPFNQDTLSEGAVYLSFYNEVFANLERDIGAGRRVDALDRNRAFLAMGYSLSDKLRLQGGYMFQKTETIGKGQLQLNFIQSF
jgi:hypothetical protein